MPSFGSIGAGLANMYPGMVAGRKNEAEAALAEATAQNAQESQQADVLRGNALMNLFAGGQPGGGAPPIQAPMPGAPSVPMGPGGAGPQMGGMPGAPFTPPTGPRPSPAPVQPLGGMDSQPAPVTAPQPPRGPTPGSAPGGGGPNDPLAGQPVQGQGNAPQLNGMGEQGGRPTIHGGVPNGPLTWQAIGAALARSNPGAPPQLIAKAIDRFAPMMTQESQMQWHLMKMQNERDLVGVREAGKDTRSGRREEGLNTRQGFMLDMRNKELAAKGERNDVSNETRMAAAALSAETRQLIAQAHEEGAGGRLLTTLRARDDWKKLDVEAKREITDMIIAGQREREGVRQEGANTRAAGAQEGANARNQNTVAGANARNQNTTQTALEVSRQRTELAKWLADGKPITATQSRISEKGQGYDSALSTIDQAIQDVATGHKEGKNVVGLVGRARGLSEIAGNIAGWSDETRRASFEQKIATLQNTLPRLLTGSSITNKDERARMGQIVQGLTAGSTKQATVHDLIWLKGKLNELKPALGANTNQGDIRATRPGAAPAAGTAPPATPTLKAMTPEVRAAFDAGLAKGIDRAEMERAARDAGFDPAGSAPEPAAPARNNYGGSR